MSNLSVPPPVRMTSVFRAERVTAAKGRSVQVAHSFSDALQAIRINKVLLEVFKCPTKVYVIHRSSKKEEKLVHYQCSIALKHYNPHHYFGHRHVNKLAAITGGT